MGLGLGLGLNKPKGLIYFQNQFSMEFDGVDDRIITDGADTVAQPTTYSFWSKSSETGSNTGVFGHGASNRGAFHFNWNLNRPLLYLSDNFYKFWVANDEQSDGEWHHWVVYSDTNDIANCKLYVDGVLQNESFTSSSGSANAYTESLTIGSDQQVGGNSFEGQIDEFAVYDRELTQAEITRMYNTYYTNNLIQNSNFDEIGPEEITNGNFSQIGSEEVTNGDFSQIGSERVTNGDFATDSNWNINGTFEITNGRLHCISDGSFQYAGQGSVFEVGKTYKLTFDIVDYTSGSVRIRPSGQSPFNTYNANGTYTEYITATDATLLIERNSACDLFVDNISVKEVGQDWTLGASWSIANGKASSNGLSNNSFSQNSILTIGKTYKLTFDLSHTSGTLLLLGSYYETQVQFTSSNNYEVYIVPTQTNLTFYASSFVGSIDNISIKEVGQDWSFGTGWSTDGTKAIADSSSDGNFLYSAQALVIGKTYKVSFSAIVSSGTVRVYSGGFPGLEVSSTSSFTGSFVAAATQFGFYSSGFDGSIDNISVKEVAQNWEVANTDADNYVVFNGSTARLKFLNTSPVTQLIAQGLTLTSGTTYKLIVDVASVTSGSIKIDVAGISEIFDTSGVTTRIVTPTSTTSSVSFYRNTADVDITLNSVVVQELKHSATNLLVNSGDYQSANPLITSTKSMEFDGVDTTLEANSELSSGTYSFSAWIKRDTIPSSWQYIVDFRRGNLSSQYVAYNSTGGFGTGTGSDIVYVDGVTSGTAPNDTKWHHIVVTGLSIANSSKINIGSRYTGFEALDGLITEAGLWDRTLTSLEVASLYNQGMPTNLLVNRNNYQSGNPTVFNTKQVDFDGTDDYLNVDTLAGKIITSQAFSISIWFKSNSNATSAGHNILFSAHNSSGGTNIYRLGVSPTSSGGIFYGADLIVSNTTVGSTVYNDNEWHHLVVAKSTGASLTTFYVDGASIGTIAQTNANWDNAVQYSIGQEYDGTYITDCFTGKISQLGIFNSTLTADEVSSLYNHGLPIDLTTDQAAYESSSNLVGYWRMGSGTLDSYPLIADQTNATLGSELVTNGDFSNGTNGWGATGIAAINIVNGELEVNVTGGGGGFQRTSNIPCVDGRTYLVSIDYRAGTYVGDVSPIIDNVAQDLITPTSVTQTETWKIVAIGSSFQLSFVRSAAYTGTIYYDNVSVKQVNGNPAIMTNQTSSDIENGSPYANVIQNGTFDTDSDWSKQTGWSIANGVASSVASGNGQDLQQSVSGKIISGKTYKVEYTISNHVTGGVRAYLSGGGAVSGNTNTANGTYIDYLTAPANNTTFKFTTAGGGLTGSIDNVTVEEVNTGLQGYWKMGDGTNDEYPVIYDQTNPTNGSELVTNGNFATDLSGWTNANNHWQWTSQGAYFPETTTHNPLAQILSNNANVILKLTFTLNVVKGTANVFYLDASSGTVSTQYTTSGTYTLYTVPVKVNTSINFSRYGGINTEFYVDNVSVKQVQGNPATMTNMVEGNITNQYPLTKIRNYYRMGDGILDSKFLSYPATNPPFIFQDQTSPNLAHIPTTNLLEHSERFTNGYDWTVQSGLTVTDNFATAPNGTQTASKVIGNGTVGLYQQKTVTGNVARSVYLKSITGNVNVILKDPALTVTQKTCNLTTEWQRFELSEDNGHGSHSGIWIDDIPASGIYIWGAQLEAQSQATAYIKSDGIAAVRKATTTNLLTYSEDITSSTGYTTSSGVTISSNQGTSPIGDNNATKLTSTGTDPFIQNQISSTKQIFTLSIYAKGVGSSIGKNINFFLIRDNYAEAQQSSAFVLTNDWVRYESTLTLTGTPSANVTFRLDAPSVAVVGDEVLIWGAQLEEQTQAETYAKTTGLPVTIDLFTENNYGHTQGGVIQKDVPRNS